MEESSNQVVARFAVREGRYAYVRVRPNLASTTLDISNEARATGIAETLVNRDDVILEVAVSSTSDPDFEEPRGEVWRFGGDT